MQTVFGGHISQSSVVVRIWTATHCQPSPSPLFTFSLWSFVYVFISRPVHVFISDYVSVLVFLDVIMHASMHVLRCEFLVCGSLSFCLLPLVSYLISHLSQNLDTQKEFAINCESRQHLQWAVSHLCCVLCCVLASDRQGLSHRA